MTAHLATAGAVLVSAMLLTAAQASAQVGYAVVTLDAGNSTPMGSALFTYRNSSGVLVSEAGVGSAELMQSGRIFVDEAGTKTAIALVNPGPQSPTDVTLILRDDAGTEIERKPPLTLGARQQTAGYISDWFTKQPPGFTGSLTFISSGSPLAAITLRESQNTQGELLYTTLPVVDLGAATSSQWIVLPQIAADSNYVTQLVLINPGSQTLSGRVSLFANDGSPLLVRVQGNTVAEFTYSIAPDGTYRPELDGVPSCSGIDCAVGYAVVTPDSGATPAASAILQYKPGGNLMTEAGVGAIAATAAARIFVDYIGAQTGIAVVNPGNQQAVLTLTLMDRYGSAEASVQKTLAAGYHFSNFVHELFPAISDGYSGLMEIRSESPSTPFVPITLKLAMNTRNDLVLTTLPVADLTRPPTAASIVFPYIALGAGYSTRLILLNTSTGNAANGKVAFYQPNGNPMPSLQVGGQTGSEFGYRMVPGGGRQFYPGNTAAVASISLVEPLTNQITSELVINQGDTRHPGLLILDSAGGRRDDFDADVRSLDSSVAAVDEFGGVQGKQTGFSTLVIMVAGHVITGTATVVGVNSGVAGFETIGVVQDPARRLFLASAQTDSILLAQDVKQTPQTYAGIPGTAGLINDLKPQSLFSGPSFLALNQAEGSLYVSDKANHVIRRIPPGPSEKVTTLAGTGVAGSGDGDIGVAAFNNPQGVALDQRGNLWVADSGNHTIRRIDLVSGNVKTIAGQAGVPGYADGNGTQAQFRFPAGIALETETATQQLMQTGASLPPVSIIVADSGNGLIRRVNENGEVTTIGSVPLVSKAATQGKVSNAAAGPVSMPTRFTSPVGVAVDPAGNIYVSESSSGQVKTILRTGEVVLAAEAGTFVNPTGLAVAQNGKVVVAAADRAARELAYGEPRIASISPDEVSNKRGQTITIKGSNFARDTLVAVSGVVISGAKIVDTQTITFTTPVLPSGRGTLTVQNRGGLDQKPVQVDAVLLRELPAGYVTTVAGGSTFAGEGGPALMAPINPAGIALDAKGNLFVADGSNRRVRRIDSRTGIVTTAAGTGESRGSGDGGPAITAGFSQPNGVAFDSKGNLLIADYDRIRKVDAVTGIINTVVGGQYGYCGDGENVLNACFDYISGFTVDAEGNLFVADKNNQRVRRVDGKTNIITTIAGNGQMGFSGDGGDARAASLNFPFAVAVDDVRKVLYIADTSNGRIRSVDLSTNIITTLAGGGPVSDAIGDGQLATAANLEVPAGLAVDAAGNLLISDLGHNRIRKVDIGTNIITTVAGPDSKGSDGAPAATLQGPSSLAVDAAGNILIADGGAFRVWRVEVASQIITTFAGNGREVVADDGVKSAAATLGEPAGVTVDAAGNLFITDTGSQLIRRVDAVTGNIDTIAGGGRPDYGVGDGGPARNADLSTPSGNVALDAVGNIYIADRYNYRVRKIDSTTKIITTIAGNGQNASSGDDGPATAAGVLPDDIALDRQGNLYIAENASRRIRKVSFSTGLITTFAGGGRPLQSIGDGGPATAAVLGSRLRITVDSMGSLFIADYDNERVRKVDPERFYITTVAGGGGSSLTENQRATSVSLVPSVVAVDTAGNLFIVDLSDLTAIRRVSAQTQFITTVAGPGQFPDLGDNGPAIAASFFSPSGMAFDVQGNLFIADAGTQRIRAVRGPIP